jgi:hypothetical protein
MSDQRVSIFISHKVSGDSSDRRAATRIKAMLESRAERLDVTECVPPFTHPVTQRVEGLSLENPQHPEKGT